MSILDYLHSQHVPFEPLLFSPASCATRLAHNLHVPGQRVAKGVLLRAESGFLLAVLPATHRIELDRLTEILDIGELRLANEDELEHVFADCERGASPPFGRPYGLTTVIDASLAGGAEIICEGNTRHEGVRLRFRDYEALESPVRARFSTMMAPPQRRTAHRRAG